MNTWTVSTAAELKSALANAAAGDEILLESGDYGSFNFDGYNFSNYVTIKSADGNLGAKFVSMTINGSSHIRIDGVHVDNPTNGASGSQLVTIDGGSSHIEFLNSEINGLVDNEYQGHRGLYTGNATDIRLEGNYVHDVKNGIVASNTKDLVVAENDFDYLGNDGMKFISVRDVLIENNFGPGHVFPAADAHLDFIQFQGGNSSNIVVRGNVVLPQMEYYAQGIFFDDAVFTNVLIENNIVNTALGRAISVSSGSGVIAQNNTVLTVPGFGHKAAQILLPSGSVSQNNVQGFHIAGLVGSNLRIEWDDPNSIYYYDKVYQNASAGWSATLEDLRPVPGGPADFGSGLGAEARLFELLEGSGARPDAIDDSITVDEDGSATLDPLANDTDPEGSALALTAISTPANGTAVINADGTISYTPDPDFFGSDSFSYTVQNANESTDRGTVNITVNPVNDDVPVANDDSARVIQGNEIIIDVLGNDFDPDGTALSVVGHSDTASGTLTDLGGGRFSYQADVNATGIESFTYTIRDASGATATATVTIQVDELGAVPVPVFSALADGSLGTDRIVVDHDTAYLLPQGTLELGFIADQLSGRQGLFSKDSSGFDNGGHLTILLEGADVLVRLQSTSATHEIRAVNTANSGAEHHLALTFGPGGMQLYIDGVIAGTNPYTGGLEGNAEPIVIGANQWGSGDGIADVVQDDFAGTITTANLYDVALDAAQIDYLSNPGGLPSNAVPSAVNDVATTNAGEAITIDLLANDSDADGDALSLISVDGSSNYITINADGTVTYTPDAGFSGTESLTYTVTDGTTTDTAKLTVTVNPPEPSDPPAPGSDVMVSSVAELLSALGAAQGGDTILLADGNYGALSLNGINFSSEVTIASENPGGAVFTSAQITNSSYLKIEGIHVDHPTDGVRFTAIVEISGSSHHVSFVNNEVNGSIDNSFGGAYGIRVNSGTSFVDVSDNTVHNLRHGAVFFGTDDLTVSGNEFEYIGEDSLKFGGVERVLIENNTGASLHRAADSAIHPDFIQFQGDSSDAVIRGNVFLLKEEPTPGYPVQGIFLKDGVYNDILIEDNIVYTNTANGIYIESRPGGGNITIRENTVLSPPDITKFGFNDIRVIAVDGAYTVENNIVDRIVDRVGTGTVQNNLRLQFEDPNAPNYYNDVYQNATAGVLATIEDFRPVPGGPGDFGSSLGAEGRLQELLGGTVDPAPNTAPVAADDSVSTGHNTAITIDVLSNDSDADGDLLSVENATASGGSVTVNTDSTLTYAPVAGFSGTDTITYTISDGQGGSATASVTVTVNAAEKPNTAPIAVDDNVTTAHGTAVTIDVLGNDSDPDGGPLTIVDITESSAGTVTYNADDSTLTFTPADGFSGTETIAYAISDGRGGIASANVIVNVDEPLTSTPSAMLEVGSNEFNRKTAGAIILDHTSGYELDTGTLVIGFVADELLARQGLFTKDASGFGLGGHLSILLERDTIVVRMQDETANYEIRTASVVRQGQEHKLALSFGESGMALHLDGVALGNNSYTGGLAGNVEPVVIGANQWASSAGTADSLRDPFDGTISEVSLYTETLSPEVVFGAVNENTSPQSAETINGSTDDDVLVGTDSGEILIGDAGNDSIYGGSGGDVLNGDDGDDHLIGGFSQDTLSGGDGDDTLDGGQGNDTLDGGDGIDTGLYDSFGGAVILRLTLTTAQDTNAAGVETISNIENLIGGTGNDRFTGSASANMLDGAGGSDQLFGLGGNDSLFGDDGNDELLAGAGTDMLDGGDGRDVLIGGTGNDSLFGGDANDVLRGGGDSDVLIGGLGRDVLAGGDFFSGTGFPGDSAADTFRINSVAESARGAATRDVIRDFEQGLDAIDLAGIDADETNGSGDDAFTFISAAAFSGTAGELRAINPGANTVIFGDTDGDGAADLEIFVNGSITFQDTDFGL